MRRQQFLYLFSLEIIAHLFISLLFVFLSFKFGVIGKTGFLQGEKNFAPLFICGLVLSCFLLMAVVRRWPVVFIFLDLLILLVLFSLSYSFLHTNMALFGLAFAFYLLLSWLFRQRFREGLHFPASRRLLSFPVLIERETGEYFYGNISYFSSSFCFIHFAPENLGITQFKYGEKLLLKTKLGKRSREEKGFFEFYNKEGLGIFFESPSKLGEICMKRKYFMTLFLVIFFTSCNKETPESTLKKYIEVIAQKKTFSAGLEFTSGQVKEVLEQVIQEGREVPIKRVLSFDVLQKICSRPESCRLRFSLSYQDSNDRSVHLKKIATLEQSDSSWKITNSDDIKTFLEFKDDLVVSP